MALTINRRKEITIEEFAFIKKKFNKKTNSKAIYACVKFVVEETPDMEKEIKQLRISLKKIMQKHNALDKTIAKEAYNNTQE
ncbi:MAG: hypothetical protein ABFS35_23915 [Bacteroidota bacterium]